MNAASQPLSLFESSADSPEASPPRPAWLPVAVPDDDHWPAPPAPEAFCGLAGEVVAAIAPFTEADPVAILVQLLVGVGSILGPGPHYQVGATRHRANEYVVLVGPSGSGRKGSSWDAVEAVLGALDRPWTAGRVVSGLSSGEGLIWHLRDREDGPAPDPRLMVIEPELASVLKAASRETNTLSPVLRNAWDGKALQVITKHDPARASTAHVSIVGHITSDELVRYISATEAANGFLNRFLLIAVRRARLLPEGALFDHAALAPLTARLADAIASNRAARPLGLNEDARAIWWDIYPHLSTGRPGMLGAICGRAEAHVVRLALLYALLDRQDAIGAAHLRAALALWDYAARSAAFIFGDSLGDPIADEINRAISEHPGGLTRSQIRDLFARNRPKAQIDRALHLLAGAGTVNRHLLDGPGRPTEVWSARPTPAPSKKPATRSPST
ncbi:MAG: DUF3987 domain-containing protein [Acidimicrobiales bacterium]